MLNLRDKKYEEGWLKDHDNQNIENKKLDLRKLKNPNLMDSILKFNETLF